MNTLSLRRILVTAFSVGVLMAGGGAHAAFRAYLSVNGNDANPCTVGSPCRLLPAALAAADPEGEVWMLDSANFNIGPVIITKSVTILAVPGALGSVVALGGDAIVVNTAGVRVTLRNLVVLHFSGGNHGINFSQGTRVIVEGCEIYGLPGNAIHATAPGGTVTVKETTIRQNGGSGMHLAGTVTGNLIDSKVMHHTASGVNIIDGAKAFIFNSVITNAGNFGVAVSSSGGVDSRLVMNNSVIKNVGTAGIDVLANSGSPVYVTVAKSTITHTNTGINVQNGAGNSIVVLDNNVIVHSNVGVNMNGGAATGQVFSRNNNTITLTTGSAFVINGTLATLTAF